jgi:hypothetical protein
MAYSLVQENKCIFHIVHNKNLPSILKNGLLSYNATKAKHIKYETIAHHNIQERRDNIEIMHGNKGTLHDYVCFYFGARSPMLSALRYKMNQQEIVYVAVAWDVLNLTTTVFTDGNAATYGTQQFCGVENLDKVDLKAAEKWFWNDDLETRRKKSAEILVWEKVPVEKIVAFFVYSDKMKDEVITLLKAQGIEKSVLTAQEFYY